MKHWKVSYSVKDRTTGIICEAEEYVAARNITESIVKISALLANTFSSNFDVVIWDSGIMEDDVF